MSKFKWVETFLSAEGEAQYTGKNTVYVRLTNCNFSCNGFNNKENLIATDIDVLGFNPSEYENIYHMPAITRGCDSAYAWDPKFSHMWKSGNEDELARELVDLIPHKKWIHPYTGMDYALSITGGEPSLHAKQLPALLHHPLLDDCLHVIFETNCSVPLTINFISQINAWLCKNPRRRWTWSNSPKLSSSGEPRDKAIRPDIALRQAMTAGKTGLNQVDQYFKFVVHDEADVDEVESVMQQYYAAGVNRLAPVWLMPASCTHEQQQQIAQNIATLCMERGYLFSYRLQNALWENAVGR